MQRDYSPHAAAYAARSVPDVLRDWRRKGFLSDIGRRKGKGNVYTLSDVARIAVGAFIARSGANLAEAFQIVHERGSLIDSVVAAECDAPGDHADYFLTFVIDPDASFPASITSAPVDKIDFDSDPIGVLQVNVSKLVRSVLDRLAACQGGTESAA